MLLDGPVGDLIAARQIAHDLLSAHFAALEDPTLSRMTLAAICLHVANRNDGEVSRNDLIRHLTDLCEAGLLGPGYARSPIQFVRYAAAEVQALKPPGRAQILRQLLLLMADLGNDATPDLPDSEARPR